METTNNLNKYEYFLKNVIKGKLFLGSELKKKLVEKFNCKDSYARKIVSLAVKNKIIKKYYENITFGKGQYMYIDFEDGDDFYFEETATEEKYKKEQNIIMEKFKENRPNIYRVLKRYYSNKEIISYFEIYKLSACTTEKTSSKITQFEEVISILKEVTGSVVKEDQGAKYLVNQYHAEASESSVIKAMKEYYVELKTECIFLPIVLRWLQNTNLVNTNVPIYRRKDKPYMGAILNNLVWDAFSYTGTVGFNEKIKILEKSQVLIELAISKEFQKEDLDGFYDRLQILRNSVKKSSKRRIIPILFIKDASYSIIKEIKNLNIMCFNIKTIFGEKIIDVLENIGRISTQILYNFNESREDITYNVEEALNLIEETGQGENLNNLKGDFFEALMCRVIYELYPKAIIRPNYKLSYTDENNNNIYNFEYDFIVETKDEKIVFELKGYSKDSVIKLGKFDKETQKPEKNTIKWFFNYTFQKAKKRMQDSERAIKACYITTAKIEEQAIKKIQIMEKTKPKELDIYYDRKKLIELLKSKGFSHEVKLIEQYY